MNNLERVLENCDKSSLAHNCSAVSQRKAVEVESARDERRLAKSACVILDRVSDPCCRLKKQFILWKKGVNENTVPLYLANFAT